jgi:hypothetical protein
MMREYTVFNVGPPTIKAHGHAWLLIESAHSPRRDIRVAALPTVALAAARAAVLDARRARAGARLLSTRRRMDEALTRGWSFGAIHPASFGGLTNGWAAAIVGRRLMIELVWASEGLQASHGYRDREERSWIA